MKKRSAFLRITMFIFLLAALVQTIPARAAGTCYVDDSATGGNNGTDWANAYTDLQSALGDTCSEIWVAAGTYKPDASDRTKSFVLKDNTAIYGGFNGTETMLSERNLAVNITILSGDLAGDDSGTNDGLNTSYQENSYHVVLATGGLSINAVLDGFMITGGYANNPSGSPTYYENGGGMYNNDSSATLTNLIFSNNYALGGGGGLQIYYSNGTSILTNVTFNGNFAGTGGGLYNNTNSSTLTNVTFINNHSYSNGGGMYNFWLAPVLTNVTFSGNSADANGGGLYNMSNNGNDPTLTNVTFSGNTASSGGGLYNNTTFSGTALLKNVIIANSTGGDCVLASGSLNAASSYNLIEDGSNACGLTNNVDNNIVGSDPNLGSLTGSPAFIPLKGGSPAIDAGTNTVCPSTDQRGASRPQGSACDIGAVESLVVMNTNDDGAGSLRQAIADASGGESITFDASLSGQTIPLTSGTLLILKDMTIDGSALASQITIDGTDNWRVFAVGGGVTAALKNLIVTGGWLNTDGGAGLVNNGTLTITNSIFSYHTADNQFGGAILNNSTGNLTIIGSTFSNNSAFGGGAIANYNQLTVRNSTFINNGGGSTDSGGAIYTDGASGTLTQTITNNTFSGNSANVGGAIWSSRTQTITNSTFSGNAAHLTSNSGGAVWQDAETLNLANTIMANSSGEDCRTQSTIGIHINNLIEDGASCAPSLTADPMLDTLADNGGPTQTFALLPGSPAINAGDDTTCAAAPVNNKDQRGITRPNGDHCDLGAYEHQNTSAPNVTAFNANDATTLSVSVPSFAASDDGVVTAYLITESSTAPAISNPNWTASAPTSFTVTTTGSHTLYPWAKDDAGNVSAVYGSPDTVSVCLPMITVTNTNDSGAGSLRQAIADACNGGTITFNAGLSGTTIHLASTLIINNKDITIDGSSLTSKITISGDSDNDGDGDVRILSVTTSPSPITVMLNSLIFTKGQATTGVGDNGDGGAILNDYGIITVTNSTFLNNSAVGSGGAISNNHPLTVINSTFSNNSSTASVGSVGGGAILTSAPLTISGSTFSDNTADANAGSGGAIWNASPGSTITNSTFSGNSAGAGGGIITTTGDLTITNSTISGNSAVTTGGLAIDGGTINLANTIIANNSASYGPSNDDCTNGATLGTNTKNLIEDGSCSPALSGDPNLGSLANNGGSTQTFALLAGSKAIDAGADTICDDNPGPNNLDQRGTTRPSGGHCDIGAYEYVDTTAPSVTTFTAPSLTKNLNIPITSFLASDDAVLAGYLITENNTQPLAGAAGWSVSVPTAYTVGSGGSYVLYPWVKDATGHVSLVHAPANVTVDATAPTVVSIMRASANPTASISVNFTVTFSESVTGVGTNDFSLTTTGAVTGAAVTAVNGSGTVRTISVNTGSGDGTIRLNIPGTATITDTAGNNVSGLPYQSGQSYTISKTLTFTSTGAQDGWVLESLFNSEKGGTLNSTGKTFNLGDDATKKQYRGILSFNTSSIPDNATITGVILKVKKSAIVGGGNPVNIFKGFMADIKNGIFGALSLQTTDFQTLGTASYGPFIVAPVSNVYSINLTAGKLNINKLPGSSGLTQIRLRFKLGDNNNAIANTLILFSGNATNATDRPQLVITYNVP